MQIRPVFRPQPAPDMRLALARTAPLLLTAFLLLCADAGRAAVSAQQCGPVWGTRHWGPFDYRRPVAGAGGVGIVENAHFTPWVEAGLGGKTGPIGGDLNYTLRAFPNHHRALVTLAKVTQREKKDQLPGMEWPVECYYERAIRFAPDDVVVYMLYAQWLGSRKRVQEAEVQLGFALPLAGDNPQTHYNIGLLYFELGNHEAARRQAIKAKALGWPLTALVDQLKSVGQWPAHEDAPAEAPTSAPAAALPGSAPASAPARSS
jgi:hypothetical protein